MPFDFKRDVLPDHPNHFEVTPTATLYSGPDTIGRCSELCGLYHSRMLFRIKIVTPAQFHAAWVTAQQLAAERIWRCSVTTFEQPAPPEAFPSPTVTQRPYHKGSILADWLSSTDHKIIGHLYLITSFFFFLVGGVMAMIMRAQLLGPNNRIVSDQQYNELFTMQVGTIMLLLFRDAVVRQGSPTRSCRCR